ncbi:hypothetical protein GVAV_000711 [Gurleya vavrai]
MLNNYSEDGWEKNVAKATAAYNLSFNRSILTSPYLIKYGMMPNLNIDNILKLKSIEESRIELQQKNNKNKDAYINKSIVKGKIQCKDDYKIGDEVFIYKENNTNKFFSDWIEGF